jgi:hypothetical protein
MENIIFTVYSIIRLILKYYLGETSLSPPELPPIYKKPPQYKKTLRYPPPPIF